MTLARQVNEHGLTDGRNLELYGHAVAHREPYAGPVIQLPKK